MVWLAQLYSGKWVPVKSGKRWGGPRLAGAHPQDVKNWKGPKLKTARQQRGRLVDEERAYRKHLKDTSGHPMFNRDIRSPGDEPPADLTPWGA